MNISKIVDYVKNEINFSKEFCEDYVFVTLRIEPILKIIENLEQSHKYILEYDKEIEKKDKIINLMTRAIDNYDSQLEINTFKDKEHIKEYFKELAERKVENGKKKNNE